MYKSFLQTSAWAELKQKAGWQPIGLGEQWILERDLPLSQQLEYAPELPYSEEILSSIESYCQKPSKSIFSRFEFLEHWDDQKAGQLQEMGLVKSFEEVQPEYRQWVGLESSEAELLAQMKPKGRYNLNVAKRNNLKVEHRQDPEAAEIFNNLYQQTAKRQKFQGRQQQYFVDLVALLKAENSGEVVIISNEFQPLCAGIFLYWGEFASYLYGASGPERQLMSPYLMHWEAMLAGKQKNCSIYDLLAVAPVGSANHPYSSLTQFKSQFGGQTTRLLGSWDFIRKPVWYTIYRHVESRRRS